MIFRLKEHCFGKLVFVAHSFAIVNALKLINGWRQMQESTQYSSLLVTRMFQKRKRDFGQSLQEILLQVSHDPVVRRLMQDRASSQFVTTRIEEIIAGILIDSREKFIDVLLQRLQTLEALYSTDHTSTIRALGDKILSVTDEQNRDEIAHVRRIQALMEQVRTLQAEVVRLRGSEAERAIITDDIGKHNKRKGIYDLSSPKFYTVFANVNLTDFELRVKMIQTDAQTTKEMVLVMSRKMKEIFSIVKEKTIANTAIYRSRIEKLQKAEEKARAKVVEMQKHFDNSVIPKLLAKHKETLTKHRKTLQQRLNEIEQLKAELATAKSQLKTANIDRQQLQNVVGELEQQHEADDTHIQSLEHEKIKDKQTIQQKIDENEALQRTVEQLRAENQKLQQQLNESKAQNKNLQRNVKDKDQQISKVNKELEMLKAQLPREKQARETALKNLEETEEKKTELERKLKQHKQKNRDLQHKIEDLQPQLHQVEQDLVKTQQELKAAKEDNNAQLKQIGDQEQQIQDGARQIARLESALEQARSKNNKNESAIAALEDEKTKNQNAISNLERQLKKATTAADNVRKELMDVQMASARQETKLEATNKERNRAQDELEKAQKEVAKLESEVKKLNQKLEEVEAEGQKMTHNNQQMTQQLAKQEDDKEQMKKQIKDLTKKLNTAENKIDEEAANSRDQKQQNNALKSKMGDLQEKIRELEKVRKTNENKLAENEQAIQNLEAKNEELTKAAKTASSKMRQASEKQMEEQRNAENLQRKVDEMQKVIDQVKNALPGKSTKDIPQLINEAMTAKQTAEAIMKALSASNKDDAIKKLKELKRQADIIRRIQELLPTQSIEEWPHYIKDIIEDNNRLKAEQKRISQLLAGDSNVDISKTIQEIVEKQSKISEQLNAAADFISAVLSIMTGPSMSQTRLVFPLKQTIQDKLLDLVTRIKRRADNDHTQVERVLEKARNLGYEGDDVVEAAEYIATRHIEIERQQTVSMVGRELGDVKAITTSAKEAYSQDKADSRKKIAKLKETLAQQMEKSAQREEELKEENDQLQRKVRQLTADLETEKRVREELGRIGAGLSSDKTYLRSKLNKNEMRLVEFAEKMSESDKETKELHTKQRKTREALAAATISDN